MSIENIDEMHAIPDKEERKRGIPRVVFIVAIPAVAFAVWAIASLFIRTTDSSSSQRAGMSAAHASECAASYPTICLPTDRDYDCTELRYRNFRAEPNDIHDLDRDNDGFACE